MIQKRDKKGKYNKQNASHYLQASNFQPAPLSQPAWHLKSDQFISSKTAAAIPPPRRN